MTISFLLELYEQFFSKTFNSESFCISLICDVLLIVVVCGLVLVMDELFSACMCEIAGKCISQPSVGVRSNKPTSWSCGSYTTFVQNSKDEEECMQRNSVALALVFFV